MGRSEVETDIIMSLCFHSTNIHLVCTYSLAGTVDKLIEGGVNEIFAFRRTKSNLILVLIAFFHLLKYLVKKPTGQEFYQLHRSSVTSFTMSTNTSDVCPSHMVIFMDIW